MPSTVKGANVRSALVSGVSSWLCTWLHDELPRTRVHVHSDRTRTLRSAVVRLGLTAQFPLYPLWDFRMDLTAFIVGDRRSGVVLVDCAEKAVTFKDLGRLILYSRLANPLVSFLVCPKGPDDWLRHFILERKRFDVLEYGNGALLSILTWDLALGAPRFGDSIPSGDISVKARW